MKLQREKKQVALKRRKQKKTKKLETQKKLVQEKEAEKKQKRIQLVLTSWETEFLPNFGKYFKNPTKPFKVSVISHGIPPKLRSKVWPMAIGNQLLITKDLYEINLKRAQSAAKIQQRILIQERDTNPDAEQLSAEEKQSFGKEKSISDIGQDLERTFPDLTYFSKEGVMKSELQKLLEIYCVYRPDVGYVQGMSYVAGTLLLYLEPYSAFRSFANLLNSPFYLAFVKMNHPEMNKRYEIMNDVLLQHIPALHQCFKEKNIIEAIFFLEWSLTLFSKNLDLKVVSQVWDCMFLFGEQYIFLTAIAILKCIKDKLLTCETHQIYKNLKNLPKTIEASRLFEEIRSTKLSQKNLKKIEILNDRSEF